MEFKLTDPQVCILLLMNFPFASDPEAEQMLDEFVAENYEIPSEEWFTEVSGDVDANGEEVSPWNGTVFSFVINEEVTLVVEFHPFEVVYFLNDVFIGNSGGHFMLSLLSWQEFLKIVEVVEDDAMLFFVLLPFVVGAKGEEQEIRKEIEKHLEHMAFRAEHIPVIANFLVHHAIFNEDEPEMFYDDSELGKICKRNHSVRNKGNAAEDISRVNGLIRMAMEE
ncbi:Imm19 family immunity protein [Pedobacter kyonggii]|uniref:Immunity protein 19 n=1 Tax=Pedobacter kyonggii TaxID=1926871 RepID=A0A4Q9H9H1_9SPHI|nr:Imm19 family immunity protein [Pedobacter kyonggii]TBO40569.1 hypothetical protein EYS08_18120 [Pedobacter kyonggii]